MQAGAGTATGSGCWRRRYAHLVRAVGADLIEEKPEVRQARNGGRVSKKKPKCFLLSAGTNETYLDATA